MAAGADAGIEYCWLIVDGALVEDWLLVDDAMSVLAFCTNSSAVDAAKGGRVRWKLW